MLDKICPGLGHIMGMLGAHMDLTGPLPQTSIELQDLADQLETIARAHPGFPPVSRMLTEAIDNVRLVARLHTLHDPLHRLTRGEPST
jgi:hypothetical protein